jgi:hypothetical protein
MAACILCGSRWCEHKDLHRAEARDNARTAASRRLNSARRTTPRPDRRVRMTSSGMVQRAKLR